MKNIKEKTLIWIIVFCPVIVISVKALWDFTYHSDITLGEIIGASLTLLGALILGWCWGHRWWISKSPFKMEVFKEKYESIHKTYPSSQCKLIQGIHELFPTSLTLIIKPKINKNFEQINVRFIEKRWILFNHRGQWGQFFRYRSTPILNSFWEWIDAPKNIISIVEIKDPPAERDFSKNGRAFTCYPDDKGGVDGFYRPPYLCPQEGQICLELKINIHVKTKWEGYISFQHLLGNSQRGYVRKKIMIMNQDVD